MAGKKKATQERVRVTLSVEQRCQIIEYLKDHKNVLYDQYSSRLTPSIQKNAWESALTFAKT